MPVRFEDDANNTPAATSPTPAPRRRRPRWLLIALPLGILLVGLIGAQLRETPTDDGDGRETPGGKPGALPTGEATAIGGGTRSVFGVPVGYPQTLAGATSAAITYDAATVGKGMWSKDSRTAINDYIFTAEARGSAITDELAVKAEKATGLNDSGQVLNPDGTINTQLRLYADCYPKYGAYRVLNVTPDKTTPTSVTVQTWRPCVFGPGDENDTSKVAIQWQWTTKTVSWVEGDWRISKLENATTQAPAPSPARKINPTFAERARLLGAGDGWMLPVNASETYDPTIGIPPL